MHPTRPAPRAGSPYTGRSALDRQAGAEAKALFEKARTVNKDRPDPEFAAQIEKALASLGAS